MCVGGAWRGAVYGGIRCHAVTSCMYARASIRAAEPSNVLLIAADTRAELSFVCATHIINACSTGHGEWLCAIGTGFYRKNSVHIDRSPFVRVGTAPVSYGGTLEVQTVIVLSRTDTEHSGPRAPVTLESLPAMSRTEARFWG